jgi:hypothetical protein
MDMVKGKYLKEGELYRASFGVILRYIRREKYTIYFTHYSGSRDHFAYETSGLIPFSIDTTFEIASFKFGR